jgi:small subunit ribosomal protein S6
MQAETTAAGGPAKAASESPPQIAPGTRLREYETIFLVRPDLAEDLMEKIVERMRAIVHRDGGKVIKVENWGKKKTSYEVKKNLRAIFIRFLYLGGTKAVAEFERNLRMTDDVLKYQSVKIADDVDAVARAVEADVKLPGDPEVPERMGREEPAFDSFRERERDVPEDDVPPEAE